jgi:hypothetical protein
MSVCTYTTTGKRDFAQPAGTGSDCSSNCRGSAKHLPGIADLNPRASESYDKCRTLPNAPSCVPGVPVCASQHLLHLVQGPVQGRLCLFGFAGIYIQPSACLTLNFISLLLGLMAGSISCPTLGSMRLRTACNYTSLILSDSKFLAYLKIRLTHSLYRS